MLRVALLWFFALGGLGMFFPFFSLYLYKNAQLSGSQVGLVLATIPMVGILSQPAWGQVADLSGRRTLVLAAVLLGGAAGYAALLLPSSFAQFLIGAGVLALFSTSFMPAMWSVSLGLLSEGGPRVLGWVRVCGTLGFGLSVGSFPYLTSWLHPDTSSDATEVLRDIFPLAAVCFATAAMLAFSLPRQGEVSLRARRGEYRQLLSHGPFLRVLAASVLAVICMRGPGVMLPILVFDHGGSIHIISTMWLLMLSLEVPLITWFGATVRRLSLRGVMIAGVASAAVRWLASGYVHDLHVMTSIQILHGVGVWGVIVCAPSYVDRVVPASLRSTAQGALAMTAFGVGGVISSALAGWLLENFGPRSPAQWGGAGALLLTFGLFWLLPKTSA